MFAAAIETASSALDLVWLESLQLDVVALEVLGQLRDKFDVAVFQADLLQLAQTTQAIVDGAGLVIPGLAPLDDFLAICVGDLFDWLGWPEDVIDHLLGHGER